jgi:hypothetical protein
MAYIDNLSECHNGKINLLDEQKDHLSKIFLNKLSDSIIDSTEITESLDINTIDPYILENVKHLFKKTGLDRKCILFTFFIRYNIFISII